MHLPFSDFSSLHFFLPFDDNWFPSHFLSSAVNLSHFFRIHFLAFLVNFPGITVETTHFIFATNNCLPAGSPILPIEFVVFLLYMIGPVTIIPVRRNCNNFQKNWWWWSQLSSWVFFWLFGGCLPFLLNYI